MYFDLFSFFLISRLKSWQHDSFIERYVTRPEIIEYIKKNLNPESLISPDIQLNRNNSITSFNKAPSQTVAPTIDCNFIVNDKLTLNKKKRLENQVK